MAGYAAYNEYLVTLGAWDVAFSISRRMVSLWWVKMFAFGWYDARIEITSPLAVWRMLQATANKTVRHGEQTRGWDVIDNLSKERELLVSDQSKNSNI